MSLLTCLNKVVRRTGISDPFTSVIGNSNTACLQLLELLQDCGRDIASSYIWPELNKEYTFSTADGTAAYPFPADVDFVLCQTHWNRTNLWPFLGPLSPQDWQVIKSGVTTSGPYQRFRVKGFTANQFYIDPTPSAVETLVLEFQSLNWIRPATVWVAGLVAAAGSYCYYGNNIYYTTAGGTAGSTPPTHLTGDALDGVGGVTWTYSLYDRALADTDELILSEDDIGLELEWRYKYEKGLEYAPAKARADRIISGAVTKFESAPVINMITGRSS